MEQYQEQMARQQQQWANQAANWQHNNAASKPDFMKHPGMNAYPKNYSGVNNRVQAQSNQNPVNAQPYNRQFHNANNYPRQPQYYNGPAYGNGPYNAPYGWPGRAYR